MMRREKKKTRVKKQSREVEKKYGGIVVREIISMAVRKKISRKSHFNISSD